MKEDLLKSREYFEGQLKELNQAQVAIDVIDRKIAFIEEAGMDENGRFTYKGIKCSLVGTQVLPSNWFYAAPMDIRDDLGSGKGSVHRIEI